MTSENRAELRRGIDAVVRAAESAIEIRVESHEPEPHHRRRACVTVYQVGTGSPPEPKALTTAQQLALSVLLGDESVLPQALADYLLDQGHEYAVACYENGKRDGNQFTEAVKAMTPTISAYADACRSLVNTVAARLSAPPAVTE